MKTICSITLILIACTVQAQLTTIGSLTNSSSIQINEVAARELIRKHNPDVREVKDLKIQWSEAENAYLLIARIEQPLVCIKAYTLMQSGSMLAMGDGGIVEITCQSDKCIECEMINDACVCKSGNQACYKTRRVIL